jgi:hypothetical protein
MSDIFKLCRDCVAVTDPAAVSFSMVDAWATESSVFDVWAVAESEPLETAAGGASIVGCAKLLEPEGADSEAWEVSLLL